MDDLVKRLNEAASPPQNGGGGGSWERHKALLVEAAAVIARQEAELAAARDQIGDWIVRADEANARADRLKALLDRINDKAIMNAGEFARYVRDECAALEAKNG